MTSDIEIVDDQAIYQRTNRGRQELLAPSRDMTRAELKMLGMVTGLTPLRILLDMGVDVAGTQAAISRLLRLGLIELVVA